VDLEIYKDLALDSFYSYFIFSLKEGVYFQIMLDFIEDYNKIYLLTFAMLGTTLGQVTNYIVGRIIIYATYKSYIISQNAKDRHAEMSKKIKKYFIFFLVGAPFGVFGILISFFSGVLKIKLWKALPIMVIANLVYYSYFLYS